VDKNKSVFMKGPRRDWSTMTHSMAWGRAGSELVTQLQTSCRGIANPEGYMKFWEHTCITVLLELSECNFIFARCGGACL
jgi:hypothetical protein